MAGDGRRGVWLLAIVVAAVAVAVGILSVSNRPRPGRESPQGPQSLPTVRPREAPARPGPTAPGARGTARPGGPESGPAMSEGSMVGAPGGQPPMALPASDTLLQGTCSSNVKRLAVAVVMYSADYDDHLPPAARWCDATWPYLLSEDLYRCPAGPTAYGYAFNRNLDQQRTRDVLQPIYVVTVFDSSAGRRNTADPGQSLCNPPRHPMGNNIGFLDGRVALISPLDRAAMRWR